MEVVITRYANMPQIIVCGAIMIAIGIIAIIVSKYKIVRKKDYPPKDKDKEWAEQNLKCGCSLIATVALVVGAATLMAGIICKDEPQYLITVDNTVTVVEFLEKYEIVERVEDNIYWVKDRIDTNE